MCCPGTLWDSNVVQQQQQDRVEAFQLPPAQQAAADRQYQRDMAALHPSAAGPSMDEAYSQFMSELGGSRCSTVADLLLSQGHKL